MKPLSSNYARPNPTESRRADFIVALPKTKASRGENSASLPKGTRLRRLIKRFFDTEILFAIGDFAAAYLTAEIFGIVINGGAAAIALGGKVYEIRTDTKPLGMGFYAMALVSFLTTISIAVNFSRNYALESLLHGDAAALQSAFTGAAFAAWTLANFFAGLERARILPSNRRGALLSNAQLWFCVGSVLVTQSGTVSGLVFLTALMKGIFGPPSTPFDPVHGIKGLLRKHLTTPRLRAVAYLTCTVEAVFTGSPFVLAYALWMLGNSVFESPEMNRAILVDIRRLTPRGVRRKRKDSSPFHPTRGTQHWAFIATPSRRRTLPRDMPSSTIRLETMASTPPWSARKVRNNQGPS